MRLKDLQCKQAKPGEKLYKLSDGAGLQLHIFPNGSKLWRGAYRYGGKQKTYAMGAYPKLGLAEAREAWSNAKDLLEKGNDPTIERRIEKLKAVSSTAQTFEQVTLEWHAIKFTAAQKKTGDDALHRVAVNIFPDLGPLPISSITSPMVLTSLRRIEARGSLDMSKRVQRLVTRIFNYAKSAGLCTDNPAAPVKEAMKTHKAGHFPSIEIEDLPQFLVALAKEEPNLEIKTRVATRLLMNTFVRTEELVGARWSELDLDRAMWIIPAERMKKDKDHMVPLSRQAVALFRQMEPITGGREFVFPHRSNGGMHMDNNTILRVLGRMGYRGQMTGHGFRSLAMGVNTQELGFSEKLVDLQLAHVKKDKTDRAYNRAKWIRQRTKMMQKWSDYLDAVEAAGVR